MLVRTSPISPPPRPNSRARAAKEERKCAAPLFVLSLRRLRLQRTCMHACLITVWSSGDKPCSVRTESGGLGLALACRCPRCRRRRNRFCIAAAASCACLPACLVAPFLSGCGGGRGLSPICFGRRNRRRHQPTERPRYFFSPPPPRVAAVPRGARRDRLLGRSSSARRGESI